MKLLGRAAVGAAIGAGVAAAWWVGISAGEGQVVDVVIGGAITGAVAGAAACDYWRAALSGSMAGLGGGTAARYLRLRLEG